VTARTESTRPAPDIRKDEGTEYDAIHSHPEPTRPGALALAYMERTQPRHIVGPDAALADLRALIAERDSALKALDATNAALLSLGQREAAVRADADRLAKALKCVDGWESEGRPVGVHIAMQTVRTALATYRANRGETAQGGGK
jgi:hypothetical protein